MPTPDQQKNTANAIATIRAAEDLLTQQIREATDILTATKLMNECNCLDSYLSQLLHAQNSADDASFAIATAALKSQADNLKIDQDTMKGIVGDIEIAANIVGNISKALVFIAKL